MRKRILSVGIIVFYSYAIQAQLFHRPVAAGYTGPGAYSTAHSAIFSFTANQAALAQLKNTAAGIYTERKFLLPDLNYYLFAAGLPTSFGTIGLKTTYAGFSDYNETQIGLAYARRLGTKADVGLQFNYTGISIAGYGNASAISAELGLLLHLTDQLNAGIHINNPAGGKFAKDRDEKLPAIYSAGFGYEASEKFFIGVEVRKEEERPVSVSAGFQYHFIPSLRVRAGIESATSTIWLGLGYLLKSFQLDITAGYHSQLGITPGLSVLAEFPKNKNP
jgi:hypothetical protein